MRWLRLILPALGCVAAACSNNTANNAATAPTVLRVDPESFLGLLECGGPSGTVQSYVATLYDLGPGPLPRADADGGLDSDGPLARDPFELPSSPVVSCGVGTTFQAIYPGNHYIAEIQAFDLPPCTGAAEATGDGGFSDCLTPESEGSAEMLDQSGAPVTARWTSQCGTGIEPQPISGLHPGDVPPSTTVAVPNRTLRVQGCTPLASGGSAP